MIWLIGFLALFLASPVWGAVTRYVHSGCTGTSYNPSGSGSCTGGSARVYSTIQSAIDANTTVGTNGDILYIRAGTYNENVTINGTLNASNLNGAVLPTYGATATQAATVAGYPGETVIIAGPGSRNFQVIGLHHVIFNNLNYDGRYINGNYPLTMDRESSGDVHSHHLRFSNSAAYHSGNQLSDGLCAAGTPSGVYFAYMEDSEFRDFTARDNGHDCLSTDSNGSHGFYASSGPNLFDRVTITGNQVLGLQFFTSSGLSSGSTISNSTINQYRDASHPIAGGIDSKGDGNVFYNNVFYNDGTSPILIGRGASINNLVYNNTFYNSNLAGIQVSGGSGHQVYNNLFINNGGGAIDQYGGGTATYSNNLCSTGTSTTHCDLTTSASLSTIFASTTIGNPNFLKLAGTGSPAYNAGVNGTYCANPDRAGVTRPQGGTCDVGAYEFAAAGNPPPSLALVTPTTGTTYSASATPLTMTGTALDDGVIASVTYTCTRCGVNGAASSGTASLTNITGGKSWTVANADLRAGVQSFTFTATDTLGAATSGTLTVTYTPTYPGDTLALAMGFETGSGSQAADSSGNLNNGTLIGSWTTNGKFGNAITLNGTSQYVYIASHNSLNFTQSFTFSAWVKPAAQHNDFRTIFAKNVALQRLYASVDSFYCPNSGLMAFVQVNESMDLSICNPFALAIGIWTHVAVTYSHPNSALKLYVNGALVQTQVVNGLMQPNTNPLTIGANTSFGEYFQGDIDEARAYNFALPVSAGANTSPGAACGYADYTSQGPSIASIIGDENCPVIQAVVTPPNDLLVLPSASNALELGPSSNVLEMGLP